jgi:hypothetical protein
VRPDAFVCIASGPNLAPEQCDAAQRAADAGAVRIVVVNDCWRLAPRADILYAADKKWWDLHIAAVRAGFSGECWTTHAAASVAHSLRYIESKPGAGLFPRHESRISQGANSGFQAMMLARLFGARRILLLGYDMQRTGGRSHWFGDHPKPLTNGDPAYWRAHFDTVAPLLAAEGTEVVNCSAATALACFPRLPLAEALA